MSRDNLILPLTATQFAWLVIDGRPFPPPTPKRAGIPRFGADERCWLCGGPAGPEPWPRDVAFDTGFTDQTASEAEASTSVCQACVALASKETWDAFVEAHPERGLKTGRPISWRNYSHLVTATTYENPNRARLRELLLDPPTPPFVLAIAVSSQKHILYLARIAHDREVFPVQMEDARLIMHRRQLARCLVAFEALYALGFTKPQIVSGRYHIPTIAKLGRDEWRRLETAFAPWRRQPDMVRLVSFVAQRPEQEDSDDDQ